MNLVDKSYNLLKPSAVLFDWDNTLVDSWPLIHEAINHTLKKFGKDVWSLEETKIKVHRSMKDMLPEYFSNDWQEAVKVYRSYYANIQDGLGILDKADHTLEVLSNKNIPVCVVTNKKNTLIQREIENLQWAKYLKAVIGSGDVPADKPSVDGVQSVLGSINMSAGSNIWFVGDSVTDMETAYNSGCAPVFFGNDDYMGDRYKGCRPKVQFANHKALSEYLTNI